MYVSKAESARFRVYCKYAKIKQGFYSKKSDPVLDPDPTCIKKSWIRPDQNPQHWFN
jgi:hypothetical protein